MPELHLPVTKFTSPRVGATLLPREHLLECLNQCRSLPLTLLSASASFGKATLLSAWTRHRRDAAWYAEHNHLHKAITHALEARDCAYTADLIERFIVPQSWRNEYHTLRRWLTRLPQEVLHSRQGSASPMWTQSC